MQLTDKFMIQFELSQIYRGVSAQTKTIMLLRGNYASLHKQLASNSKAAVFIE